MSYKILGISLILMLFLKILITSKLLWFFFFTILCYKFPSSWLSYHLLKFVRNIRLAQQWSPQKRDGKYCLKIIASTSSWSTRLFVLFQCLATIGPLPMMPWPTTNAARNFVCMILIWTVWIYMGPKNRCGQKKKRSAGLS